MIFYILILLLYREDNNLEIGVFLYIIPFLFLFLASYFIKKDNKLKAEFIGRGGAWLDTGSFDDFYKTTSFVSAIENRQGLKVACLEEIAFNSKWISKKDITSSIW